MAEVSDEQNNARSATPELDLGGLIRDLRLGRGISQRELARRAGLANAAVSQIEQNRVSPTVASLQKVARALGLSLAELFRSGAQGPPPVFFKADQLHEIGSGEVRLRLVGALGSGTKLQILHEIYPPGADTGAGMLSHDGEEGGVVVKGQITVTVAHMTQVLGPGDAYQFSSNLSHRFCNEGDQPCEIISACTPPTF